MITVVSSASRTVRGDGGRVDQAWKPERDTPSTLHMQAIGWWAFSDSTNSKTLTGSSRSPRRRRPRLFQDLPFLAQHPVLAAQAAQFVPLVGGEHAGLALPGVGVGVGAGHPLAQRRLRQVEVAADLGDGLAAGADELNRLRLELVGEGPSGSSSHVDSLPRGFPSSWLSTEPGQLQSTTLRRHELRAHLAGFVEECLDAEPLQGAVVCHQLVWRDARSTLEQAGVALLHKEQIPYPLMDPQGFVRALERILVPAIDRSG